VLYFLDSSALAKLFHKEHGSGVVTGILDDRLNRIFTSTLARVELTSVAAIKVRTGAMNLEEASEFLVDVADILESSRVIVQRLIEDDFARAQDLLKRYACDHRLRTLDALHLASALRRRERSGIDFFVTADRVLAQVAALESFEILIPE
jgi:predicted nucleic acid-binding protein